MWAWVRAGVPRSEPVKVLEFGTQLSARDPDVAAEISHRALPFVLSANVMHESAAREASGRKGLQDEYSAVWRSRRYSRRRERLFESGGLERLTAREGWQQFDGKPSLVNDAYRSLLSRIRVRITKDAIHPTLR